MSILNIIAAATTATTTAATTAAAATAPAAVAPTTAMSPDVSDRAQLLVLATLLVISVTTAALCGCFRRGSINGPSRIGPDEPVSALWKVFLFAAGFWFAVPMVYGMIVVIRHPPDVPVATAPTTVGTSDAPVTAQALSPEETVWIGIGATVAGLVAALAGTAVRRDGFARLGLTARDLRRAIVPGVLAVIIVLPLMFAASEITELIWQAIKLEHPSEHELLHILGESSSPALRVGVIVSALVLAPVFEELLFRGYLQTALLGLFSGHRPQRRSGPPATLLGPAPAPPPPPPQMGSAEAMPLTPALFWPPPPPPPGVAAPLHSAQPSTPSAPVDYAHWSPTSVSAPPSANMRWAAVICTSIAFALVHVQFWMMPPIFVLSLCLGYAYERTGKLWVSMLIHAAFNTTSLLLFLAIR